MWSVFRKDLSPYVFLPPLLPVLIFLFAECILRIAGFVGLCTQYLTARQSMRGIILCCFHFVTYTHVIRINVLINTMEYVFYHRLMMQLLTDYLCENRNRKNAAINIIAARWTFSLWIIHYFCKPSFGITIIYNLRLTISDLLYWEIPRIPQFFSIF